MWKLVHRKIIIGILCLFVVALITKVNAQNSEIYKNAIELNSDNDAYGLTENNDRYYTVGTSLKYFFTANKLLGLEKLFSNKEYFFFSAGIRSEAYTPTKMDYNSIPEEDLYFDRPFAGLMFGTFDANYILNRTFIKTELNLGILGPSAFSEQIQNWIHGNVAISDPVQGWEYQIPDQLLFNLNFQGVYDIQIKPNWIDLYASGDVRLGNIYIDATPTLGVRIGKFNKLTTSLSNLVLSENVKPELYFKGSFSYFFTAYNATAQGKLFNNDYEYAIEDLSHFHHSFSIGLFFTYKKIALSYENVFLYGKVVKGSFHNYGKFNLSYRF